MSADSNTKSRAAFEAALRRYRLATMGACQATSFAAANRNLDEVKAAFAELLALYDQAAHSAAAGAPDAAVDKGADLIDRTKLKEAIRNMERARHVSDERWNIVQLIDAQPSASIAPDAAVEIEGEVVDTGPHGDLWSFIHIKAELPLPIGTRVSVVRLPSPEADPNG